MWGPHICIRPPCVICLIQMVKWGGDIGQIVHKRKQGHFPLGFSHKNPFRKSCPHFPLSERAPPIPKRLRRVVHYECVSECVIWMKRSHSAVLYCHMLKLYRLNVFLCFLNAWFSILVLPSSLSIHPSCHLISCHPLFSLQPLIYLSFHPIKLTFMLQSWPTETCYY